MPLPVRKRNESNPLEPVVLPAGADNFYDMEAADRCHPEVMKAIRSYDPQLMIGWDRELVRWVILRASRGALFVIGVVETPDHRYHDLDMRILKTLASWDLWKGAKNANEAAQRMDDEDAARLEREWNDFADDIHHLTKENNRSLRRVAALIGL